MIMTKTIEIKLDRIVLRGELMPRDGIDHEVVREYMNNIVELPPVLVALDKAESPNEALLENEDFNVHVLIDGWHRYYAFKDVGHDAILAIVDKKLKPEDFFFTAARSNKAHGLRFTAKEKKRISRRLFMKENRSAAEISEAVGCSTRHASDLIQELTHEKKAQAIKYARQQAKDYSVREIAEQLTKMGFKASKSSVSRWIQPEPEEPEEEKVVSSEKSQIGEVPEEDRWSTIGDVPTLKPIENISGERATVIPMESVSTAPTHVRVCPKCKIRTVRIPKYIPGSCTKLFIYCDRCDDYIELGMLLPKADDGGE